MPCCVPGCLHTAVLALNGAHFSACLPHADATMWRLSFTEPEGRSGYLSWRAEVESRGAVLPAERP